MKLIVRQIVILLFLGTAINSYGAVNLGQKIQVNFNEKRPYIFVYSDNEKTFGLNLEFSSYDLLKTERAYLIRARLYNSKTESYLGQWITLEENPNGIDYTTSMSLTPNFGQFPDVVKSAKTDLRDLILVLSINRPKTSISDGSLATHYLELSNYCTKYPDTFINYSSKKMGCDQ